MPPELQERMREEWRAHLAAIPGGLSKLTAASGFLLSTFKINNCKNRRSRPLREHLTPPHLGGSLTLGITGMVLQNFGVEQRQEQLDGSVLIYAYDGRARVVAFVEREALDDYSGKYFGRPQLTHQQRVFLLRSENNLKAVAGVIADKYARGETSLHHGFGSTLKRVNIDLADLERAPRLEVAPLIVFDGAGFQPRP